MFRRDMDRTFDDFFGGGGALRSVQAAQPLTPAIDIDDNGKEMVVTAELPGISEKDVEVNLAGDEKRAEHEEKNGDDH